MRERIDLAFHIMDREYGVTRLLDPEGELSESNMEKDNSICLAYHHYSFNVILTFKHLKLLQVFAPNSAPALPLGTWGWSHPFLYLVKGWI